MGIWGVRFGKCSCLISKYPQTNHSQLIIRASGILLSIFVALLVGDAFGQRADRSRFEAAHAPFQEEIIIDIDGTGQHKGLPWANGRFVYDFSPDLQPDEHKLKVFEAACRSLLENTALRCVHRSEKVAMNDTDYVFVVDGFGDFSYVGRQGGKQLLGILNWDNPNIVTHEIKHALGWGHEHQHPDRDQFVDVLFENIPLDKRENFLIHDNGNEGEYDFDSVMHYYPSDFARPARKSIRVKPEYKMYQAVMGQRDHLSEIDLLEIQNFYGDPSVKWCGINRMPTGDSLSGCSLVCQLETDPAVGAWVPEKDCDA